ncbi:MAG: phosphomethylpyrimidine synthase [Candidatus Hydromicrobium americanum]|nr:MAG: phosphomethylpyrimidine synthase [Candidatus Hydromicrobium americanum]
MTLLSKAGSGEITKEMKTVAKKEGVDSEYIRESIAEGIIVIPYNKKHKSLEVLSGIGRGLRTKVNANIGTSSEHTSLEEEIEKLDAAIKAGTDTVMDLSTGGDIDKIRRTIIDRSTVPVGTVPIYQAAIEFAKRKGIVNMTEDYIFDVIEKQAKDGVDFMTVHCGVTRESIKRLRNQGRILDIVSRGGAFLVEWMIYNKKENPLFEDYDRLLEIAKKYDVTLSLGDGLRPGCLADATDRGQIQETVILGELAKRALKEGVQVIIEGPGHMPIDQIEANVLLVKKICGGAPFYVLGPLVTDISPGYDHITGAIGGALAGYWGADYLCYLTPSEHLRLPTVDDVREGVIITRIAAHAADIAKGTSGAMNKDIEMARARKKLNWEKQISLSIDPEKARRYRKESKITGDKCTMCGKYCAIDIVNKYFSQGKAEHKVK